MGSSVSSTILTDGRLTLSSVYIPKTSIITNIGWRVGATQGSYTADEYNGIGIYSIDNTTGDLTLLGKTANDNTIWTGVAALGYGNKNFESPITLEKGVYFLAYLYNSSAVVSAPTLAATAIFGFPTLADLSAFNVPTNTFLAGYINTQIELPTTILSAAVTKTLSTTLVDYIFYLS